MQKDISAEQRSRLGRRSRNKGSSYERIIARKFKEKYNAELMRTPQSGGFAKNNARAGDFRGDIVPVDDTIDLRLHIEAKNQKNWSLPSWLKQAEEDCPEGKIPCIIFHKHGTSQEYVTLSLDDFFDIVPRDSIIIERNR